MAKIGLKYVVAAPISKNTGTQLTHGEGFVVGKAISADVVINTTDDKLYADDALSENVKEFIDGKLSVGVDDISDDVYIKLLNHKLEEESKEIVASTGDSPGGHGVGFYAPRIKSGVKTYRAIFLVKVAFAEPAFNAATKADKITFGTEKLDGTIMAAENGEWKREKTFDTEADAIAWLNTKANISTSSAQNSETQEE